LLELLLIYNMLSTYDKLKLADNPKCIKMLRKYGEEKEIVHYSNNVAKINSKGRKQTRTMVITNKAVYNLVPNKLTNCKRRIPLKEIMQVTLSSCSNDFILHIPREYDYYYKSDDKDNMLKVLKDSYRKLLGSALSSNCLDENSLKKMVKTKTDTESDVYSFERLSDIVLEPYKSHQTDKGRVIVMPSRRSHSLAMNVPTNIRSSLKGKRDLRRASSPVCSPSNKPDFMHKSTRPSWKKASSLQDLDIKIDLFSPPSIDLNDEKYSRTPSARYKF